MRKSGGTDTWSGYRLGEDGRRITLYQISAGQGCVLTASCLLNNRSFPAIAVTEEACQGYVVSQQQLKQWMLAQPVWQAFIFDLLSARMGDLIEKVDQLAFDTLEQRLLQWLQQHPQAPRVPIIHQQVAEELASSREVVSRLLKKMEQSGQLTCHRGEIELHTAM